MLIASTVMSTGYSPSLFAGQRGKSGFRPSSFNFHSCWFFFFLTIHNDCLCCVGFLPAEHSTKDPVPAVHQEPAVLHSAHQSEPMPILSTEKVHRRRNEPRRSVSLIVFFILFYNFKFRNFIFLLKYYFLIIIFFLSFFFLKKKIFVFN